MGLFDMGQIGSQVGNFVQSDVGGNMLSDLGHGLLTGSNWKQGLSNAGQRAVQLAPMRQEQATKNQQANSTQAWLQAQRPDLLPLLEAGATPAEVLSMALSEQQAQKQEQAEMQRREALSQYITDPAARAAYIGGEVDWEGARGGAVKPMEINGQLVDPTTGEVMGDYRDPNAGLPPAPSGYQWANGGLSFIPGGPADPATAAMKPPTEAERKSEALTTVTQQDAALLFGDGATNPGVFDALGNWGDAALQVGVNGVAPLAGFASSDYKVAKDAISNIAQSYLYQMSGAAAPAEEVRKISEQVTPGPLDTPQQKAAKRARLQAMYEAISGAGGGAAQGGSGDGWEVIGVQ